jgi:hypothetical protein
MLEYRVGRAKELLSDPTLSLADVALACGFADLSHFTRVFPEHHRHFSGKMAQRERRAPGKYAIRQMRRGIRDAVATAGVAESPLFTRMANQPVHAARAAMDPNKAPRQHPTVQKFAELTLDEARDVAILFALAGEKGFQISRDHGVEPALLGTSDPLLSSEPLALFDLQSTDQCNVLRSMGSS